MDVQNRGVHREGHPRGETVIDDGRDDGALFVVRRLLFDEGGDRDDGAVGGSAVCDLGPHVRRDAGVERGQELVDDGARLLALIKVIGVRENEALKTRGVAGLGVFEEAEGIIEVRRRVIEVFLGADALLLQLREDLVHRHALREGELRDDHGLRADLHALHERAVIKLCRQHIGAGIELPIRVGDLGKELEKPLILDDPRVLERAGDIVDVRALDGARAGDDAVCVLDLHLLLGEDILREINGRRDLLFIEREHVARRHPAGAG